MTMTTTEFYNKQASTLIQRYDSANMSLLHQLLVENIELKSRILDIGFGSGRDLQFLYDNDYDIFGIDPSEKFVANAQRRFPKYKSHFVKACVPIKQRLFENNIKFDAVICIAVWMHLERSKYLEAVESIVSVTKPNSIVAISYSEGSRADDSRYFENVDLAYIIELFKNSGFKLIKNVKNKDSLNRDNLTWTTVIFKHEE